MKRTVLIKKVNNTELGKGNTNDTYLLIPNELNIDDFITLQQQTGFLFVPSGEIVSLRFTKGREQRIVGLGPFYRKYNLQAGDEVVLVKSSENNEEQYSMFIRKYENVALIQKLGNGYEILNDNMIGLLTSQSWQSATGERVDVKFMLRKKKRKDSPEETAFYSVKVNGQDISAIYHNKGLLELELVNGLMYIRKATLWRITSVEMEADNE